MRDTTPRMLAITDDISVPTTYLKLYQRKWESSALAITKGGPMKRSRFTEEQIIAALKEHAAGTPAKELCRRLGVGVETLYRWKRKYGGLEVSEARRLHALEDENRRLKRIVADQALDNAALKDVLSKNW